MREGITKSISDEDELNVYPFLADSAPTGHEVTAARVMAVRFYHVNGFKWAVRINVDMSGPHSKDQTDKLIQAINRCWGWIAEQEAKAA